MVKSVKLICTIQYVTIVELSVIDYQNHEWTIQSIKGKVQHICIFSSAQLTIVLYSMFFPGAVYIESEKLLNTKLLN